MNIKETSQETLTRMTAAIDDRVERARAELDELGKRFTQQLQDGASAIAALGDGLGAIIDRAEHIFAANFEFGHAGDARRVSCEGLHLRFESSQYLVRLVDHHHTGRDNGPTVRPGQRYRALVILEPVK